MGNQKNIKTTYEKYTKTPLTYFCKVSLMQFFWWIKEKTRMSPNSNYVTTAISKQFFLLFNKWSPPVKFDRKIESIIIMHIAFDA